MSKGDALKSLRTAARSSNIESMLGGAPASVAIEDGMVLLETPERLAKLREMFKVGDNANTIQFNGRNFDAIAALVGKVGASAHKESNGKVTLQSGGWDGVTLFKDDYVSIENGVLRSAKYPPASYVPEEVFDAIVKRDPTAKVSASGEVEKCGIYSQWLLGQYAKSSLGAKSRFIEDLYKATDALAIYDRRKGRLPVELRNIAAIKTIIDLERVVATLADQRTRGEKREEVEAGASEADVLMDTEQWRVVVPRTVAASRYYGKGTRWCTASSSDDAPDYFNMYSREGPLIIAINHGDQRRWQFHFESGQYMDEQDEPINAVAFFRNAPEVGAAILRYLRGRGTVLTAILDLIAPEEALSEYAKLAAKSESSAALYLHKLSMPTVLKGFESGVIGERMLNRQFGDCMVFDKEADRIAYRVDDLRDMSRFFTSSNIGRISDRELFVRAVTQQQLDDYYEITPAEVEDDVSEENYKRIMGYGIGPDEDGRLDFDKLPRQLDAAVRTAAGTAMAIAQTDAIRAAYLKELEAVVGEMDTKDPRAEGGVLFWNSIKDVTSDMNAILRHRSNDDGDAVSPHDFISELADACARETGGTGIRLRKDPFAEPFYMDSDEFNRQLKIQLDHRENYLRNPRVNLESMLDTIIEAVEPLESERIVSAAVRHNAIYDDIAEEAGGYEGLMGRIYDPTKPQGLQRAKDGFMTNTGRFVTRQEAHSIAKAANQVAAHARDEVELSSEDAMQSDAEWDSFMKFDNLVNQVLNESIHGDNWESTSWTDTVGGKKITVTIKDMLNLIKDKPIQEIETEILEPYALHSIKKDEQTLANIEKANLDYPIIILYRPHESQLKRYWILDGNHRLQKAINNKLTTIRAKVIELSDMPEDWQKIFS